ncbi:MAG: hypothetical protein WBW33_23600 [Bryobacteraceae bacterium]
MVDQAIRQPGRGSLALSYRPAGAMRQLLEGAELRPFNLTSDPLESAQGDDEDLSALLRFLLGENL